MTGPVRVGVVGYGLGGSAFHAPLVSVSPRLSLDAVVTSDPGRRAAAEARYPGVRIVPSVEELLGEADRLDLLVVTVPNALHVPIAEAALGAGLSVVVDKPVAPTAAEAERLGRTATAVGRLVVPYHNRRWDGDFRTVAALLAGGRLGDPWRFESRFERWKPARARPASWKQDPDQPGAGVLYDLGSHLIDQIIVLFGHPAAVYAEVFRRAGAVDDDVFVALRYPSGVVAHAWAGVSTAQPGPRFRVLGSEAGYVKFGLDVQEEALRAGRLPSEPGWGEEPPEAWGTLGAGGAATPVPTRAGAYQEFYAGVAATLLDGADPPVAWGDAVAGIRVIEAALRSARTGRVVELA